MRTDDDSDKCFKSLTWLTGCCSVSVLDAKGEEEGPDRHAPQAPGAFEFEFHLSSFGFHCHSPKVQVLFHSFNTLWVPPDAQDGDKTPAEASSSRKRARVDEGGHDQDQNDKEEEQQSYNAAETNMGAIMQLFLHEVGGQWPAQLSSRGDADLFNVTAFFCVSFSAGFWP